MGEELKALVIGKKMIETNSEEVLIAWSREKCLTINVPEHRELEDLGRNTMGKITSVS